MPTASRALPTPPRAIVLLGWLLLALAATLRLAALDTMEFKGDELGFVVRTVQAAHDPWAVRSLRSSAGIDHPPLFVWLFAPVARAWPDPVVLTRAVVLLNLVGWLFLYRFLRRAFGSDAALFGTLLLAAAPWAAVLGRKYWIPDGILPFLCAALWAAGRASARPSAGRWAAAGLLLASLCLVHLSAWWLVPGFVLWAVARRATLRPGGLAIGLLAGLALASPYLLALAQGGGPTGKEPPRRAALLVARTTMERARNLLDGSGFEYLLGAEAGAEFGARAGMRAAGWAQGLLVPLAVLGLAGWLVHLMRARGNGQGRAGGEQAVGPTALLLLTAASALACTLLAGRPPRPHHTIVIAWPCLPVAATVAARALGARLRTGLWPLLLLLPALAGLFQTASLQRALRAEPRLARRGDYGPTWIQREAHWRGRLRARLSRLGLELPPD